MPGGGAVSRAVERLAASSPGCQCQAGADAWPSRRARKLRAQTSERSKPQKGAAAQGEGHGEMRLAGARKKWEAFCSEDAKADQHAQPAEQSSLIASEWPLRQTGKALAETHHLRTLRRWRKAFGVMGPARTPVRQFTPGWITAKRGERQRIPAHSKPAGVTLVRQDRSCRPG